MPGFRRPRRRPSPRRLAPRRSSPSRRPLGTSSPSRSARRPASRSRRSTYSNGRYPPGDAFTIVSTAALLGTGFGVDTQIPCSGAKDVGGQTFTNDQPEQGIGAQPPFRVDFSHTCGTAFVGLSRLLTASQLTNAAARFGLGANWQLPLPAFTGSVPVPATDAEQAADTIGQGAVRVSPLAMALVAGEVDSGTWHSPMLVTDPPDPANVPVAPFGAQLMDTLRGLMRDTVASGAAQSANLRGQPVFGQVGAAPMATGETWVNWFVGFRGDIALAVLTFGNPHTTAAPLAAQFLRGAAGGSGRDTPLTGQTPGPEVLPPPRPRPGWPPGPPTRPPVQNAADTTRLTRRRLAWPRRGRLPLQDPGCHPRSHATCPWLPNRYITLTTRSNWIGDSPASLDVTGSRLGGCGPVAVMRTGPHLGGGPGVMTGPDPAGRPPWARLRPPPAPTGVSLMPTAGFSCIEGFPGDVPRDGLAGGACHVRGRLGRRGGGPRRVFTFAGGRDRGSRSGPVSGIRLGARAL